MEQGAKYYNKIYRDSVKYSVNFTESNYYPIWQKVLTWLSKDDFILDIGCGTGQFAEMIFDKFGQDINYSGIDFSGVAIKQARQKVHYPFYWVDAFKYIKNNKEFHEKFIMLEFLEHIDKDIEIMSIIPARKDIIFSVPNYESASHVRTFNYDETINRYKDLINISEIWKFEFTDTRFITLVKAVRV